MTMTILLTLLGFALGFLLGELRGYRDATKEREVPITDANDPH